MARRRRGGDKPSGGRTWLVLGIVAAVVAVGWLAFGVVAVSNSSTNFAMHENLVQRKLAEVEQLNGNLKGPQDRALLLQKTRELEMHVRSLGMYRDDRNTSILIAASAIVPVLLAATFFIVHARKQSRRRDEDDDHE